MPPENWSRPSFNQWGDPLDEYWDTQIQTPARKANVLKERSRTLTQGIADNSDSWEILRSFVNWCREREITVLATWPNICYWPDYESSPHYCKTLDTIKSFWDSQNIPVVGTPQDAMLNEKYFFNGMYHLFEEGVVERTSILTEILNSSKNNSSSKCKRSGSNLFSFTN